MAIARMERQALCVTTPTVRVLARWVNGRWSGRTTRRGSPGGEPLRSAMTRAQGSLWIWMLPPSRILSPESYPLLIRIPYTSKPTPGSWLSVIRRRNTNEPEPSIVAVPLTVAS